MSNLIRGISENGGVVFCGVDSTEIVRTAEKLHTTSATCSAALGRLLTGVSLMGAMLKDDGDSITLRVSGGGPAGVVIACTDAHGSVKGCIDHPLVELPAKENGHLDVGGAVGKDGVLTVIRDNKLQKEPTVGQVPLVSGEIAEDITSYYAYSEQIPTVCALGVLVDKDLSIACAGGYLLQLLPGATDAEITRLEQNIAAMPSVTELLRAGKTPQDMMELAMAGDCVMKKGVALAQAQLALLHRKETLFCANNLSGCIKDGQRGCIIAGVDAQRIAAHSCSGSASRPCSRATVPSRPLTN